MSFKFLYNVDLTSKFCIIKCIWSANKSDCMLRSFNWHGITELKEYETLLDTG